MVYFKTNWIKDSNQWVIRKVRPWVFGAGILYFVYNFTIYEMLGRRVVLFRKLDPRTEKELQEDANKHRSRFGYMPRYEPTMDRSIKRKKYDAQTFEEMINDVPRLKTHKESLEIPNYVDDFGLEKPEKTRELYYALLEHSRTPGAFDYTKPQTKHSLFPDVEIQGYVTLGSKSDHNKLQISKFST
jgi:hypothetical protein